MFLSYLVLGIISDDIYNICGYVYICFNKYVDRQANSIHTIVLISQLMGVDLKYFMFQMNEIN